MAIKVSENGRLFTLQTKDSSYQMFADDKNVLLHLYYGEKIGEENLSSLIFNTDMGFAGNPEEAGSDRTYSLDTLPQEVPSSGVGDYRDDMVRTQVRQEERLRLRVDYGQARHYSMFRRGAYTFGKSLQFRNFRRPDRPSVGIPLPALLRVGAALRAER